MNFLLQVGEGWDWEPKHQPPCSVWLAAHVSLVLRWCNYLEKMEELNEVQQHCKTKNHKRCSFRCELCNFPRAAELVVGESVWK